MKTLNNFVHVQKWMCVFCGQINNVAAERLNAPRNADMLFVPEGETSDPQLPQEKAAPTGDTEKEGDKKEEVDKTDESVLLFTIDISGSMGCTVAMSVRSLNFG